MADKRMMVLPAEVVARVDENRGDLSQADFINLLLDNQLGNGETDQASNHEEEQEPVTWVDLAELESGIKDLLRSFLEFFITYGLEIGKESGKYDLAALTNRLNNLPDSSVSPRGKRTKIR